MKENDQLAKVVSAAGMIRAFEILNGSPLTVDQFKAYLKNYDGKYPEKTLHAGMGILATLRKKRKSGLSGLLAAMKPKSAEEKKIKEMVERTAEHILSNPDSKKALQAKLKANFAPQQKQNPTDATPFTVLWARERKSQRSSTSITNLTELVSFFILKLDSLFTDPKALGQIKRSDTTIFELGCYLLFRIDFYLYKQHRDQRNSISDQLAECYIFLFEQAFERKNIGEKYNQRINLFSELIQKTQDPVSFHARIEQMMIRSSQAKEPQDHFIDTPLIFCDAMQQHPFKLKLLEWEKTELTKCLNCMKDSIHVFTENESNKSG